MKSLGNSRHEIDIEDKEYPERLKTSRLARQTLYAVGDLDLLNEPMVGVTGTRRCTPYGLTCANLTVAAAVAAGAPVMNGGARGIETHALKLAQDQGLPTVVFMGTGADYPYPSTNTPLFEQTARHGCIVSFEPWGTRPVANHFRYRAMAMPALARALVICEAGEPSVVTQAAHAAMEQGLTKVFAFPGSVFSPASRGTNRLIADGAVPLDGQSEVYDMMRGMFAPDAHGHDRTSLVEMSSNRIVEMLMANPMRADAIVDATEGNPLEVLRELAALETEGSVVRLPDGSYHATERALLRAVGGHTQEHDER